MSVLVLGTVAIDNIKTPFGIKKGILGGSASHFAMSARLFSDVHIVAVIGRDFPDKYIDFLKGKKIVLDSLVKDSGQTFRWDGKYEGDLNNAITLNTHLGVLATFRPRVSEKERKIKHVFLANVDPEIQMHFLDSMSSAQLVGLDTMNYWIDNKRKALLAVLKRADIFVANEHEARSLSGENNLIKAAKYLYSCGPRMVLIKKGEHGSMFYGQDLFFLLPAYPSAKVIDPTGAGDTFAGGVMGYLAKAKKINAANIKKAICYGTIAASFNVEGFGVDRTSRLTFKDLKARLRDFKKMVSF
jgi:sugar/nucleoside kinase (ribokinase family)